MAKKKVHKIKIKDKKFVDFAALARDEAFNKKKRRRKGTKGNKKLVRMRRGEIPVPRQNGSALLEVKCPKCKYKFWTRNVNKRLCGWVEKQTVCLKKKSA